MKLRAIIAGLLTALVVGLLVVWLEQVAATRQVEQLRLETVNRVAALRARLEGKMNSLLFLSSGLANYVAINPQISQSEFQRYAARMHAASPLMHNITLAPDNVIAFVYPLAGNRAALGLDLYNHPEQGWATRRMLATKNTVVAGPVELVQGGSALIIRVPIYLEEHQGRREYWGLTSIPLRLDEFYRRAGLRENTAALRVALRGEDGLGAAGAVFFGDPELFEAEAVIQDIEFTGGTWQIAGLPPGGWQVPLADRLPRLLSGLLAVLLIGLAAGKLAHQAQLLRRSEANYRELVENVDNVILRWRADGTIIFINEYGLRLFGYSREELLGRSVIGAIVPASESGGRDLAAMMADLAKNPENHLENENENICKDGRRLWIAWNNRPIFDQHGQVAELFSIGTDHTRRRAVELELKDSEERYRSMVVNLPGAIYRCGIEPRWRLEYVSDAVEEITGFAARDFLAGRLGFPDIIYPGDRELVAEKVDAAVAAQEPFTLEYRILDATGNLRWVNERGRLVADGTGERWLDGVIFDISERKLVEEQLRQARDAANAANKSKSAFLANMSHELRTPLNAVIGYSEILLEDLQGAGGDEAGRQVEDLNKIRNSAKHLLELINEILEFSRQEAGRMTMESEECDLAALISDIVGVVQPLIPEKGNRLGVELAPDLGCIQVDPTRLRQVLYNLLGNAAKFTENGFITLRARRVSWGGRELVQIDVQDTGIGISREQLGRLFRPFSQADSSVTRQFGGTGLGLAISRYFCRLMGGDITVSSVPGVGSTFTVALPTGTNPSCHLPSSEES